jgi:glucose/mannose-6-phosphate isomerase
LVSSFSGNTEETISSYESAISLGCPCVVSTSGGHILELAQKENHPIIQIPGGRPPRTALGYLFFPLLVNFIEWGMIKSSLVNFDELFNLFDDMVNENNPLNRIDSQSMKIANACFDRLPVFYSSAELYSVGLRWKGQLCENSKLLTYYNSFPEMNHNEIIGWQRVASMKLNERLAVFFLRDKDDHIRIQKRMDIVRELIHQSQTPTFEIFSRGETLLARMFSLLYLADFVSFNLAMLNKEDPTPIKNIDYLKSSLSDLE